MSRICEEFPGCLPSRVLWEIENDPDQLVLKIMRVRSYERAKAMVDKAENEGELPQSDLIDQIITTRLELKYEIFQRKLAARTQQRDG